MSDTKRKPPNAGKGRPKGSVNRATAVLKDQILGALDELGGQKYFVLLAQNEPASFATLLGKILPTQVTAEIDGKLTVEIVRFGESPPTE